MKRFRIVISTVHTYIPELSNLSPLDTDQNREASRGRQLTLIWRTTSGHVETWWNRSWGCRHELPDT